MRLILHVPLKAATDGLSAVDFAVCTTCAGVDTVILFTIPGARSVQYKGAKGHMRPVVGARCTITVGVGVAAPDKQTLCLGGLIQTLQRSDALAAQQ